MTDYIMNTYNRKDIAFKRGEGVYLWDSNDKKYLEGPKSQREKYWY